MFLSSLPRLTFLALQLLILYCFIADIVPAQTFRILRPVRDKWETNGSYLYAEPNIRDPRRGHTGIDILVRFDSVFAVADGIIRTISYEEGGAGYYIFEESRWNNQPVWYGYFHLSKNNLKHVGDSVKAGELIAISGNTGYSTGPHLHFEIRVGSPDYLGPENRRNPELWFAMEGMGAIYGRVPNAANATRVDIYPDPKPRPPYTTTYSYSLTYTFDRLIGSDDIYKENYAIGDVKPGTYIITALGGLYRRQVEVTSGAVVDADKTSNVEDPSFFSPGRFFLAQNYPNPFNSSTRVAFYVPGESAVDLFVSDVLGRSIHHLWKGEAARGWHEVEFDAVAMPSGVYFIVLSVPGEFFQARKALLLK